MYTINKKISYKCLYKVTAIQFLKGFLGFIAGFVTALFSSSILDLAVNGQVNRLAKEAIYFISYIIGYEGLILIINIYYGKLSAVSGHMFKLQIYEGFYGWSISTIEKFTVGEVKERFNDDTSKLDGFVTNTVPDIANGLITLTGYLIYIMRKNVLCGIIIFAIGLLQILPPLIVKKFMVKNYQDTRNIEAEVTEYIVSGYNGLSTIKLFNLYDWFEKKFIKLHERYMRIGSKGEITFQIERAMDQTVDAILKFGTYAVIGLFVLFNKLQMALGIQIIVLSGNLYGALKSIFSCYTEIFVAKQAEKRLKELYSEIQEEKVISKTTGYVDLELKQVGFSYGEHEILKDVSFTIFSGEKVAITGENGAGKSTLFKLLMGFYSHYKGEILYNKVDISKIKSDSFLKQIAWLPQQDNLFLKSPEEFFQILNDTAEIKQDRISELADRFALKKDMLQNEKISDLSGGERKKVFITAALSKESSIIFLDEPTNSLDLAAQKVLADFIESTRKTVIVICHNREIIDLCDVVIEVKDKKVKITRNREVEYEKASL